MRFGRGDPTSLRSAGRQWIQDFRSHNCVRDSENCSRNSGHLSARDQDKDTHRYRETEGLQWKCAIGWSRIPPRRFTYAFRGRRSKSLDKQHQRYGPNPEQNCHRQRCTHSAPAINQRPRRLHCDRHHQQRIYELVRLHRARGQLVRDELGQYLRQQLVGYFELELQPNHRSEGRPRRWTLHIHKRNNKFEHYLCSQPKVPWWPWRMAIHSIYLGIIQIQTTRLWKIKLQSNKRGR